MATSMPGASNKAHQVVDQYFDNKLLELEEKRKMEESGGSTTDLVTRIQSRLSKNNNQETELMENLVNKLAERAQL